MQVIIATNIRTNIQVPYSLPNEFEEFQFYLKNRKWNEKKNRWECPPFPITCPDMEHHDDFLNRIDREEYSQNPEPTATD